jgi:Rad3-related DNA helicase
MNFLSNLNALRKKANSYAKKVFNNKIIPRDWQGIFTTFDRIKDVHCKVEDYLELIGRVGIDKMVMDQRDDEAKFMCVDSSGMIKRYLHNKAKFKVFMSATIGNPESFMSIMGIENAKFIRLGNSFNYDKSPIVFINRHKLNVKERAENLPKVVKLLDKIISKHKGQRGIIHCGSYEFMNYIKKESKHIFRLVDYENSKGKSVAISKFKNKHDGVLIGPSILEGLDLSDDTSRFQIFFKVPYPYLGDPLIKAKMKESSEWYDWKTGISVLQGVGRSVRNEDDWAVTYVLDACFNNLLKRSNFLPPSFMERVKIVK